MDKKIKQQPNKTVIRIVCPKCGELQVKIYPWSSIAYAPNVTVPLCKKCSGKK